MVPNNDPAPRLPSGWCDMAHTEYRDFIQAGTGWRFAYKCAEAAQEHYLMCARDACAGNNFNDWQ